VKGTKLLEDENLTVGLDEIPVYIRGGRIVASFSEVGESARTTMDSPLVLHIALDESSEAQGLLYFDDGETYDYLRGEYVEVELTVRNGVLKLRNLNPRTARPSQFTKLVIEKLMVYGTAGIVEKRVQLKLVEDVETSLWNVSKLVHIRLLIVFVGVVLAIQVLIHRRKRVLDCFGFKDSKYAL